MLWFVEVGRVRCGGRGIAVKRVADRGSGVSFGYFPVGD